MPRSRPEAGCHDLAFHAAYPVDEPGEVALEDYARAVRPGRRGRGAARGGPGVGASRGVHVCGVGAGR